MNTASSKNKNKRIGFNYYPDTLHYKESDLKEWMPESKALGTHWLALNASIDRAIPEAFIAGLLKNNIQPILYFNLPIDSEIDTEELDLLLQSYKKWGVKFISLFDRPNMHEQWGSSSWAQLGLVERFLDIFLPLAERIANMGLKPIFPALEPGGDYWDTAFLRGALTSIKRRGKTDLVNRLVLGAYAWAGNHAFNYGAGGPERWPGARPYFTPKDEEDHLGFRIFDWYNTISEAVLGQKLPIILMGCGSNIGDQQNPNILTVDETTHGFRNLHLARILSGQHEMMRDGAVSEPLAENVLAACFWVLATEEDHPEQRNAWYKADGTTLPVVQSFQSRVASQEETSVAPEKQKAQKSINPTKKRVHKTEHYLLLPRGEDNTKNINIEFLLPFINKHHPMLGFSVKDAVQAKRVTIIGNEDKFPKGIEKNLRNMGCKVNRITGSGISIATQLETI